MARNPIPHRCKDCKLDPPPAVRAAPHPGPRCATHHRLFRKAQKARTRDLRREKVYGLPPDAYEAVWAAQGRVCAACGKPIRSKPCIDHNHDCCPGPVSCGKCVRGILHPDCNRTLIGRFGIDQLLKAARYLIDNGATAQAAIAQLNQGKVDS